MDFCLESKTTNCKNCYKCIRHCPIKSISFAGNKASIIKDSCILCGRCYLVCPQEVKVVRNDVDIVKNMINSGQKVYASLAPSFVSYYSYLLIKLATLSSFPLSSVQASAATPLAGSL